MSRKWWINSRSRSSTTVYSLHNCTMRDYGIACAIWLCHGLNLVEMYRREIFNGKPTHAEHLLCDLANCGQWPNDGRNKSQTENFNDNNFGILDRRWEKEKMFYRWINNDGDGGGSDETRTFTKEIQKSTKSISMRSNRRSRDQFGNTKNTSLRVSGRFVGLIYDFIYEILHSEELQMYRFGHHPRPCVGGNKDRLHACWCWWWWWL